jgi:hypothetical protein
MKDVSHIYLLKVDTPALRRSTIYSYNKVKYNNDLVYARPLTPLYPMVRL